MSQHLRQCLQLASQTPDPHQQGAIIARNLQAIAEGNDASPAHVTLRGTLMKLGLGESAANIAFKKTVVLG